MKEREKNYWKFWHWSDKDIKKMLLERKIVKINNLIKLNRVILEKLIESEMSHANYSKNISELKNDFEKFYKAKTVKSEQLCRVLEEKMKYRSTKDVM